MSRATYLRALDKCNRISDIGTVCSTCGTAYVADPKKENTETCGLCKIRLADFMQKLSRDWQKVKGQSSNSALSNLL